MTRSTWMPISAALSVLNDTARIAEPELRAVDEQFEPDEQQRRP